MSGIALNGFVLGVIAFKSAVLAVFSTANFLFDLCRLACPCAVYQDFRNPLKDYQLGYYDVIKDIVDARNFEREDFTVVLQPFLMEMKPLRLVRSSLENPLVQNAIAL